MFSYRLYGLLVRSDFEVAGPQVDGTPDLQVLEARDDFPAPCASAEGVVLERHPQERGWLLRMADRCVFWIRADQVQYLKRHPRDEEYLPFWLLGPVLALVLELRGGLVLHASAVHRRGEAVAFLGVKGAGKSTMAAAMWRRGFGLLSDDLVALDGLEVQPGPSHLKIWPDAVAALGGEPARMARLTTETDKRLQATAPSEPAQLKTLCLLRVGPSVELRPLAPTEALAALVAHSFNARYGSAWLDPSRSSQHFLRCGEVARRVQAFSLTRPPDLNRLDELAALVEECA